MIINLLEFIYLIFNVQAFVSNRSYTLSSVKNSILTDLLNEYHYTNMDFETNIYETNWKAFIENIEGVDHHTSYVELFNYYTFESAYESSFQLSLYPVTEGSVKVYIKDTTIPDSTFELIGTDDSYGEFTEETGYDLVGSTINYETGAIQLIVGCGIDQSETNYSIKVIYQIDNDNLEFNKRYQFFRIADESEQNISTEYTE